MNRSIQVQISPLLLLFVVCKKDGEFTQLTNEIRVFNVEFELILYLFESHEIQTENKQKTHSRFQGKLYYRY